jgi:hypothetical protein
MEGKLAQPGARRSLIVNESEAGETAKDDAHPLFGLANKVFHPTFR